MILLGVASLAVFVPIAPAQMPAQQPVATAPPLPAKYELIQNSRAMKETYILDRYSGNTWQLVQSSKRYVWQKIQREAHDRDVVPKDWTGPAYQISVSGLAAKGTYMINAITGATWILFEDPDQGIFWGAVPEPK
jgi:hypothetical protein